MQRRFPCRLSLLVAAFGLIVTLLSAHAQDAPKRGRKYKSPPPTARIEVTVLRDVNGKPIENAAVVFHPMQGERDKGNMELKTNEDGKAVIDVLPMGDTVRLQIIAKGFQTYGEDYKIDKAEMAIEIKMKRPGEQYSIYKPHDAGEVGGKSPDADKTAAPAPGAAPPASSATPAPAADKPADAAKPDAQPSQPQSK
ncbi:MAG: carboxypeptidase-like regulatory domain-containing protein [Terracidiphilus sp.]